MSKLVQKILTIEEEIMFLETVRISGWVDRVAKLRKEQDVLIQENAKEKLDNQD